MTGPVASGFRVEIYLPYLICLDGLGNFLFVLLHFVCEKGFTLCWSEKFKRYDIVKLIHSNNHSLIVITYLLVLHTGETLCFVVLVVEPRIAITKICYTSQLYKKIANWKNLFIFGFLEYSRACM